MAGVSEAPGAIIIAFPTRRGCRAPDEIWSWPLVESTVTHWLADVAGYSDGLVEAVLLRAKPFHALLTSGEHGAMAAGLANELILERLNAETAHCVARGIR